MANEITATAALAFQKGSIAEVSHALASFHVDVAGAKYTDDVQNIGTSEEAITKGDISSLGWAWFKNLDATNYVEIRAETGGAPLVRLKPGMACLFPLSPAAAPFAIANGSSVNLQKFIVEA